MNLADQLQPINPSPVEGASSAEHVAVGANISKPVRVFNFSADEWERFVEEWASSLKDDYVSVQRMGGANDHGVDVACFSSEQGFEGDWDNYQCKHYGKPLTPTDIWVELGKLIYHSYSKVYLPPKRCFFVAPRGVGTKLGKLLESPTKLKAALRGNWNSYCREGITSKEPTELNGELEKYFDAFDFSIFSHTSVTRLIEQHSRTPFHAVVFGGGLPTRPASEVPPDTVTDAESGYVSRIIEAYQDATGTTYASHNDLEQEFRVDFLRQRERFFHAESLRNFARDTVPAGTFTALKEDVFISVIDEIQADHKNGYRRMQRTMVLAAQLGISASPLASVVRPHDKQGICHQLANDGRIIWVTNGNN